MATTPNQAGAGIGIQDDRDWTAVPVLAGSAAYAVSETFRWRASLESKPSKAPSFYAVIAVATALGVALNFMGLDPIKALYWSAVLNGIVTVLLMFVLMLMAGNKYRELAMKASRTRFVELYFQRHFCKTEKRAKLQRAFAKAHYGCKAERLLAAQLFLLFCWRVPAICWVR